jgi:hypothetical protein
MIRLGEYQFRIRVEYRIAVRKGKCAHRAGCRRCGNFRRKWKMVVNSDFDRQLRGFRIVFVIFAASLCVAVGQEDDECVVLYFDVAIDIASATYEKAVGRRH